MIGRTRTCVMLSIRTVYAVDFSSETSGNTFGASRVALCNACKSFLNTNLAANSVEFEVSKNIKLLSIDWNLTVLTDNWDPLYGPFGEKRPGLVKTKRQLSFWRFDISIRFYLRNSRRFLIHLLFLLQSKYHANNGLSRRFRVTFLESRILIVFSSLN